jgi:ABC-type uncharacterized transport system substrate-binding protein
MLLPGAAMTVTRQVFAQKKGAVIGILDPSSGPHLANWSAFREGVEDIGLSPGLIDIEYRWTDKFYRLPLLAVDLITCNVDVIATGHYDGVRAARAASEAIPIVFFGGSDLTASGVIDATARPGSNLAGIDFTASEFDPGQLDLLSQLVPRARPIALLVNSENKS